MMRGEVDGPLGPDDYAKWLERRLRRHSRRSARTWSTIGRAGSAVLAYGCVACHTFDGQRYIGPTWSRLFDSRVPLADGQATSRPTKAYLTRSMMDPGADLVRGFPNVMPRGYRTTLTPPEVGALVEFHIRSLENGPIKPPAIVLPAILVVTDGGTELSLAHRHEPTMTTIAFDEPVGPARTAEATRAARPSYLGAETTVRSWLTTTDHKRIGVMYLVSVAAMLFVGGLFAMAIRLEHLTPGPTLMTAVTYNRLFSLHGITMVWLFMIPSIPAAFGNFMLPIMIGARDVAFPRLNLASLYIYLAGLRRRGRDDALGRGLDTGWTFYQPYTARSPSAVVPTVIGIFIIGWSTILTGVNFIATTHTMRAKGLGWMQLPLFVWTMYGTSIIQVLATPVLALSLVLIAVDHRSQWGESSTASRGGDPVLFQHLFWFYSHPAVYIMILPAMGVVSEVVSTFAHKNPFSYRAIVYSTLGIAFVGFLTWGHHMFVTPGLSDVSTPARSAVLSMLVAIFSAIKVYAWTGTFYKGAIVFKTPLLYVFSFLFLFVFGGMTGVAVASMSLDVHWHDTYFVVAHFHFIMAGGTVMAFLAALHYWWPKITGRMYDERVGDPRGRRWSFLGVSLRPVLPAVSCSATRECRADTSNIAPRVPGALHVISTVGFRGSSFFGSGDRPS